MSIPQPPNDDYEFDTGHFLKQYFIKVVHGSYRYVQNNSKVCELFIQVPKQSAPYKRGITQQDVKSFYSELENSGFHNPSIILIATKGGFLHAFTSIYRVKFDMPNDINACLQSLSKMIDENHPQTQLLEKPSIIDKIRKVFHLSTIKM